MAAQKNNRRVAFYEIVLSGPVDVIHGFLAGLRIGAGSRESVFFSLEEKVDGPRIGDRVKEFIHVRPRECHLVVAAPVRALIKKGARRMAEEIGVELVGDRRVKSAHCPFRFHAFAPRYGREIETLLEKRPAGLKLTNYDVREKVDPDARGIEAYAPTHDYEIAGTGVVSGPVDVLIAFRRELDRHPLVEPDLIKLDLA